MRILLIHPNYRSGGAEIAGNWPLAPEHASSHGWNTPRQNLWSSKPVAAVSSRWSPRSSFDGR